MGISQHCKDDNQKERDFFKQTRDISQHHKDDTDSHSYPNF